MEDLLGLCKEIDTSCLKVRSLVESHIPVITYFMLLFPQPPTLVFGLCMEDDVVPIVSSMRGHEEKLQDPMMDYQ